MIAIVKTYEVLDLQSSEYKEWSSAMWSSGSTLETEAVFIWYTGCLTPDYTENITLKLQI